MTHHANGSLRDWFPVDKITTFFAGATHEQIEHKKYNAASINTLVVKNINGSISIVTKSASDPIHNTIFMQATKKAPTQKICQETAITSLVDQTTLIITSTHPTATQNNSNEKTKQSIDYQFIVPLTMNLILETQKGSIVTEDTHGTLHITTNNGTITCTNSHHTLAAHVKEIGPIIIEQAHKPIHATTKKGDIVISDSLDTITAHTHKGKIVASCSLLPQQGNIQLKTEKGHITLHLPPSINASVMAQTARGTVTSDHLITLHAQTTRLNSHAWNTFKKEVHGTLGSVSIPTSSIVLNNNNGNIKILDAIHA